METDNSVTAAGGFLVHALPGCDLGLIEELEDRLRKVRPVTEMIREGLSPRRMMEEAVGRRIDVREEKEVTYFCPCTKERVRDALVALGPEELDSMAREKKPVTVHCEFCRTAYTLSRQELACLAEKDLANE